MMQLYRATTAAQADMAREIRTHEMNMLAISDGMHLVEAATANRQIAEAMQTVAYLEALAAAAKHLQEQINRAQARKDRAL